MIHQIDDQVKGNGMKQGTCAILIQPGFTLSYVIISMQYCCYNYELSL